MLIRSQDRTKFVDIAGKTISIDRANAIGITYANSNVLLGKYTSKEKAMKVLDMVQESYINGHIDYQMPEDSEVIENWCESEYIEKPTITSKEKAFLDLLLSKYKYIARDKDTNKLFLYIDKPSKHFTYWLPELKDSAYELLYKPLDIKFDFITWENEEPWSIEDLKKLEVKDE